MVGQTRTDMEQIGGTGDDGLDSFSSFFLFLGENREGGTFVAVVMTDPVCDD